MTTERDEKLEAELAELYPELAEPERSKIDTPRRGQATGQCRRRTPMATEPQYSTEAPNPTKRTESNVDDHGSVELTYDSLCSVEIGETAKGEVTIKSVKAYAVDVMTAGTEALAEFKRLKEATNG